MNNDIRISVTLTKHPKTLKLMRRLGDRAFYNLVCLWIYVAMNKPTGKLTGLDEEDLELTADWQGEPGKFVQALCELAFLDDTEDGYVIHDWLDYNEFVPDRSMKANEAAQKRWGRKQADKPMDGASVVRICTSLEQGDDSSVNHV